MEKMGRNLISNSDRSEILSKILDNIIIDGTNDRSQTDIIILLNNILEDRNNVSDLYPKLLALIYVLEKCNYKNILIDILVSELKSRIIRESVMGSFSNTSSTSNTDVKREKLIPKNGNFTLPPEGETTVIYRKYNVAGSDNIRHVDRVVIDHEGYILDIIDSYNEKIDEIDSADDLLYNNLLDKVLEYDENDVSSDNKCNDNCDGCDTREEEN